MAEGSFAQAHSNVLRLVLLGASLAVAWAVVGAIAAPSSASAVEPGSDNGSLVALDVVTDVYPVDEVAVPLAEPAGPVTDLAATDLAVTDLASTIGDVGTATAPLLDTLAPVDELLAAVPIALPVALPVAVPVVVAPAETAPVPAAVEPAPAASRSLPGHAPVAASSEIAAAAPQDLPVPSPPSPANRAVAPATPSKTAGSGGANGIPTAAAEALFDSPAAPGPAELAIAGVHDAPLSPSPGALDSPPD